MAGRLLFLFQMTSWFFVILPWNFETFSQIAFRTTNKEADR